MTAPMAIETKSAISLYEVGDVLAALEGEELSPCLQQEFIKLVGPKFHEANITVVVPAPCAEHGDAERGKDEETIRNELAEMLATYDRPAASKVRKIVKASITEARKRTHEERGPTMQRFDFAVSVGYSPDMRPNASWQAQELFCPYEHCIENSPLGEEPSERACWMFGHDCPGGSGVVAACKEGAYDHDGSKLMMGVNGQIPKLTTLGLLCASCHAKRAPDEECRSRAQGRGPSAELHLHHLG